MGQSMKSMETSKTRTFSLNASPNAGSGLPANTGGMPAGMDVSGWQQNVDWGAATSAGATFAFVKASEGTWASNNYFNQQYQGSANAGMIRGAYHFALPNVSNGVLQAQAFVQNGGGWSADGITLPGVLDIEADPYVNTDGTNQCYGMSPGALTNWIGDFTRTYKQLTGRDAIIYTAYYFWQSCVGSTAFSQSNPLWLAAYTSDYNWVQLFGGWPQFTFWQFSDNGPFNNGDSNIFNGGYGQLQSFATGVLQLTAIQAEYNNNASLLGSPTTGEICGTLGGGCYQLFQNGAINWTPATGAHYTRGAIRAEWASTNFEKGPLGYPTTDEICGTLGGGTTGCKQNYQGGVITWTPTLGALTVDGGIGSTWIGLGADASSLGLPTSEESCGLRNGGCYQVFQNGEIHWSPQYGAFATSGSIQKVWASLGYESGQLGYPISPQICGLISNGCYQLFEKGRIMSSPTQGTYALAGAIGALWAAQGFENGSLGYPTGPETCGLTGGGCYQNFQNGQIHWSPATGAHSTHGAIGQAWAKQGFEIGRLGFPTSEETTVQGVTTQSYQGGSISWSPTAGATVTYL